MEREDRGQPCDRDAPRQHGRECGDEGSRNRSRVENAPARHRRRYGTRGCEPHRQARPLEELTRARARAVDVQESEPVQLPDEAEDVRARLVDGDREGDRELAHDPTHGTSHARENEGTARVQWPRGATHRVGQLPVAEPDAGRERQPVRRPDHRAAPLIRSPTEPRAAPVAAAQTRRTTTGSGSPIATSLGPARPMTSDAATAKAANTANVVSWSPAPPPRRGTTDPATRASAAPTSVSAAITPTMRAPAPDAAAAITPTSATGRNAPAAPTSMAAQPMHHDSRVAPRQSQRP